jgi:lantibiotic modifying enzyme
VLKRKECHGDMADIHVYTAKKLEGMADSLEKSEQRRQEFIANVSHELKRGWTDGEEFKPGGRIGGAPDGKCHGLWGLCQM